MRFIERQRVVLAEEGKTEFTKVEDPSLEIKNLDGTTLPHIFNNEPIHMAPAEPGKPA